MYLGIGSLIRKPRISQSLGVTRKLVVAKLSNILKGRTIHLTPPPSINPLLFYSLLSPFSSTPFYDIFLYFFPWSLLPSLPPIYFLPPFYWPTAAPCLSLSRQTQTFVSIFPQSLLPSYLLFLPPLIPTYLCGQFSGHCPQGEGLCGAWWKMEARTIFVQYKYLKEIRNRYLYV